MNGPWNLFVLPFAGATARLFLPMRRFLPASITLIPLDPPGHGARLDEAPFHTLEEVVSDTITQIQKYQGIPFAIYGHSFGGRIAERTARRLCTDSMLVPQHVFLSGCGTQGISSSLNGIASLPDDQFIEALKPLGGGFPTREEFPDFYNKMMEVLRADFAALCGDMPYNDCPLDVPLTLLWSPDDVVTWEEVSQWEKVTLQGGRFVELTGDHFFPLKHLEKIAREIAEDLAVIHEVL